MTAVAGKSRHFATVEDLLAIPEGERFHEIIDGELVRKAMPSFKHGGAQTKTTQLLRRYNRRSSGDQPGGWWFVTEVEVDFAPGQEPAQVYRPDVAGWRRERLPQMPEEVPVRVRPDWVCEVLSSSNARNDTIKKKRAYHRFQVPHYWLIDPDQETLAVHRWTADGYVEVLSAERGERVRAEPFDAIELQVSALFGDDEEE